MLFIDEAMFSNQSSRHLAGLLRAVFTISQVGNGLYCWPIFHEVDGDDDETECGSKLGLLVSFLDRYCQAIANELKRRTTSSDPERKERAWALIEHEAGFQDGLPEFLAFAAQVASEAQD